MSFMKNLLTAEASEKFAQMSPVNKIIKGKKSSNRLQHTCYRKWKKEDKRFSTKEKNQQFEAIFCSFHNKVFIVDTHYSLY